MHCERPVDGFVAGTWVHTKDGLKPIEHIKVGDLVWSQPEETGERVYQPVVNSFVFEEKPIFIVGTFYAEGVRGVTEPACEYVCVTGKHPFWNKNDGWTRADQLTAGDVTELSNGANAYIHCAHRVYRTDQDNVGWATGLSGFENNDGTGSKIYFEENSIRIDDEDELNDYELEGESGYFKKTVYNFEVAVTHTYYVGSLGTWVHNTNCGERGVQLLERTAGVYSTPRLAIGSHK